MKGPSGRKWGEVIRVHGAPGGNIWVFHRCFNDQPNGDATCFNRGEANPPILEFDPACKLLRSFGAGLFVHPHGFTVDRGREHLDDRHQRRARPASPKTVGRGPQAECPAGASG